MTINLSHTIIFKDHRFVCPATNNLLRTQPCHSDMNIGDRADKASVSSLKTRYARLIGEFI